MFSMKHEAGNFLIYSFGFIPLICPVLPFSVTFAAVHWTNERDMVDLVNNRRVRTALFRSPAAGFQTPTYL